MLRRVASCLYFFMLPPKNRKERRFERSERMQLSKLSDAQKSEDVIVNSTRSNVTTVCTVNSTVPCMCEMWKKELSRQAKNQNNIDDSTHSIDSLDSIDSNRSLWDEFSTCYCTTVKVTGTWSSIIGNRRYKNL